MTKDQKIYHIRRNNKRCLINENQGILSKKGTFLLKSKDKFPDERACLGRFLAWDVARSVGRGHLPMAWDTKPCHSYTTFPSQAFFSSKLQINKGYLPNSFI